MRNSWIVQSFLVAAIFSFYILCYLIKWNFSSQTSIWVLEGQDPHERRDLVVNRSNVFFNLEEAVCAMRNEVAISLPNIERRKLGVKINNIVKSLNEETDAIVRTRYNESAIAVLVLVCDRVTVERCLKTLLKFRPSAERFPIIVSHDCSHNLTAVAISQFGDQIIYLRHPERTINIQKAMKDFIGYYHIAKHYEKALNQTFLDFGFKHAIIVEDDLEVSPDFFEYFLGTLPILEADPTLFCISAWNDNGKLWLIQRDAPGLLHRTDFFPGLGWMVSKKVWLELAPKWPDAFWDDWIRRPEQMKGRACIRPEISRTKHISTYGVSGRKFYMRQLRYIYLNQEFVPFSLLDLTYLLQFNYDTHLLKTVIDSKVITAEDLLDGNFSNGTTRTLYCDMPTFQIVARSFCLMRDFIHGVPRTGYHGIVSFFFRNARIYLTMTSTSKEPLNLKLIKDNFNETIYLEYGPY